MRRTHQQWPSRGQCAALCCIVLALLISIAPCPARAKTTLSLTGMYGSEQTARNCLNNIWRSANKRLNGPSVPNCLRMAFHDAGTYSTSADNGGANGSILNELNAAQNAGLNVCASVMPAIIADVRAVAGCNKASTADIIQVTGAVAVYMSGGPACSMLMGRPDSNGKDDPTRLPSNCNSASQLLAAFTSNGFTNPSASLVVLSGAHNIGNSRTTQVNQCSRGIGPMTQNGNTFDGHYYSQLVGPVKGPANQPSPGWFTSDNQLFRGGNAVLTSAVSKYAANHSAFVADWCQHYQEMGLLGVNPAPYTRTSGWLPTTLPPRQG